MHQHVKLIPSGNDSITFLVLLFLQAYIGLLAAVHRSIGSAVFEAHHMKTPTAHGNVVDCETTSGRLWQTLQNLASALPYMVSPIVHAALQYRYLTDDLLDTVLAKVIDYVWMYTGRHAEALTTALLC